MTLQDLLDSGITIEGHLKIQCWENDSYPTIYYEGDDTIDLGACMDREVTYMFPYNPAFNKAGICIELAREG